MKLKHLLINYRAENNMTQEELAKKLNVHRTTVIEYEKGKAPRPINEAKIRILLGEFGEEDKE